MTARRITKALEKAGIPLTHLTISRGEIEVMVPEKDNAGTADDKKTSALQRKVSKALPQFKGGYKTGYGAWCLQESPLKMGDYNDASSRWHY